MPKRIWKNQVEEKSVKFGLSMEDMLSKKVGFWY